MRRSGECDRVIQPRLDSDIDIRSCCPTVQFAYAVPARGTPVAFELISPYAQGRHIDCPTRQSVGVLSWVWNAQRTAIKRH